MTRGRKRKRMEAAAAAATASGSTNSSGTTSAKQAASTIKLAPMPPTTIATGPQMTMVSTGYIPISSLNSLSNSFGGPSGARGINGQETTAFTAIPIDEDADDLFGK